MGAVVMVVAGRCGIEAAGVVKGVAGGVAVERVEFMYGIVPVVQVNSCGGVARPAPVVRFGSRMPPFVAGIGAAVVMP